MEKQHVCPWWLGYTLLLPVRRLQHDPVKILEPHIKSGMSVLDYGSAMGYFSIPLAKMVGPHGKVYCVDIQEEMLKQLQKRALRHHVSSVIEPLLVQGNYNPSERAGQIDFVLLFAVAHEVSDKSLLFNEIYLVLKAGGKVLFAEPKGHVSQEEFNKSIEIARKAGLKTLDEKPMKRGLNQMLIK